MTAVECGREHEVVREVLRQRSLRAESRNDELDRHVAACAICAEVVAVTTILSEQRDETLRAVHVPAAGQVWWRAALRSHAEAVQVARRPIVWLQGIAGACAVGLGAGLVGLAWPSVRDAALWILTFGLEVGLDPRVAPLLEGVRSAVPFVLAGLACLVLTPIVVYFALSDD